MFVKKKPSRKMVFFYWEQNILLIKIIDIQMTFLLYSFRIKKVEPYQSIIRTVA